MTIVCSSMHACFALLRSLLEKHKSRTPPHYDGEQACRSSQQEASGYSFSKLGKKLSGSGGWRGTTPKTEESLDTRQSLRSERSGESTDIVYHGRSDAEGRFLCSNCGYANFVKGKRVIAGVSEVKETDV